MFQLARTQRPSLLSSRRWKCKYICQVSFIGNLAYVILVIHAQISRRYCWIAFIFGACLLPFSAYIKEIGYYRKVFFYIYYEPSLGSDLKYFNQYLKSLLMLIEDLTQSGRPGITIEVQ